MDAAHLSGATAMADALVEATQFGRRLYPSNVVCNDDEQISERVRFALADGHEAYPLERTPGWTYLLVGPRAESVAPDAPQATADAVARACAPACGPCDYCLGDVAPVVGLLPVPAGASVPVLLLCELCTAFLSDTFPTAHFITLEH